jgi:hypothetical protein
VVLRIGISMLFGQWTYKSRLLGLNLLLLLDCGLAFPGCLITRPISRPWTRSVVQKMRVVDTGQTCNECCVSHWGMAL